MWAKCWRAQASGLRGVASSAITPGRLPGSSMQPRCPANSRRPDTPSAVNAEYTASIQQRGRARLLVQPRPFEQVEAKYQMERRFKHDVQYERKRVRLVCVHRGEGMASALLARRAAHWAYGVE